MPDGELTTAAEVRAHYGEPDARVIAKQLTRLDRHARRFIALSPFLVIASADGEGRCDATPRGDAPGFVTVLDDARVAIPDRIGNRRVDTMMNVAANPRLGILFLVPGINETLRVNGRARMTSEDAVIAPMTVHGKRPRAALLVEVEEVFFHCGKALMRSDVWNPERQVPRDSFPSLGQVLADQLRGAMDHDEADRWIAESYRDRLY